MPRKMKPTNRELRGEKLSQLAEARVPRAVRHIILCGNLAAYNPSDEQAQAIVTAITEAVNTMKMRFQRNHGTLVAFRLPSNSKAA